MNVNISWFNILVLKLFSNKNDLMVKLQYTHHVENCIHACTLYTFMYVRDIYL